MKTRAAFLSIALTLAASVALAAPVKDVCKGCVDPYSPTAERGKFFKAAGVDNELDTKEFKLDQARGNGFVRKFDSWTAMLPFDKDENVKFDWFEADAYRRALRARVMVAYDKNKDKKLAGPERDAANKALLSGKLPPALKPTGGVVGPGPAAPGGVQPLGGQGGTGRRIVVGGQSQGGVWKPNEQYLKRMFDKNRDGKLDDGEQAAADKWQVDWQKRREEYAKKAAQQRKIYDELRKKHDADGDGKLNDTERKAYYDAYRKSWQIRRWDKDGDNKLNEEETAAKEKQEAKWKQAAEESRRRWHLQRWDKDKDGEVSEEEQATADKWQEDQKARAAEQQQRYAKMRADADGDGDGQLDPEERKAYYAASRKYWQIRRWDKDGDGEIGEEEAKAKTEQEAKQKKQQQEWRDTYSRLRKESDGDGDGQLNEDERKVYSEKMREYWDIRRGDKNGDGKLDEEERKALPSRRGIYQQGNRTIRVMPGGGGAQLIPRGTIVNVAEGPGTVRITPGGEGAKVWSSPDGRVQGVVIVRPMNPKEDE